MAANSNNVFKVKLEALQVNWVELLLVIAVGGVNLNAFILFKYGQMRFLRFFMIVLGIGIMIR